MAEPVSNAPPEQTQSPSGGSTEAPAVDTATLRAVAKLARLHLPDAELAVLAGRVGDVLQYVARLQTVDADDVEPMAHTADSLGVPRPDQVSAGLPTDAALANAPKTDGQSFLVPRILDAV